jgi:hypothetical protein
MESQFLLLDKLTIIIIVIIITIIIMEEEIAHRKPGPWQWSPVLPGNLKRTHRPAEFLASAVVLLVQLIHVCRVNKRMIGYSLDTCCEIKL